MASYKGPDVDQPGFLNALRELRLKLAGATLPKTISQKTGKNLKTYELPFLSSQVARVSIFPADFQQRVLQIKAQVEIFNSDVTYLMRQFDLTFNPSLGAANRAVVQGNLEDGYGKQARTATHIADLIAELEGG